MSRSALITFSVGGILLLSGQSGFAAPLGSANHLHPPAIGGGDPPSIICSGDACFDRVSGADPLVFFGAAPLSLLADASSAKVQLEAPGALLVPGYNSKLFNAEEAAFGSYSPAGIPVPEPSTIALFLSGLIGVLTCRRQRAAAQKRGDGIVRLSAPTAR